MHPARLRRTAVVVRVIDRVMDRIIRSSSLKHSVGGVNSVLLQIVNLGQQLRGFILKLCALHLEILFRILACAEFEVEVAQILVELLLAFQQKIEPRLFALAGEGVFRPEGVDNERDGQQRTTDQSHVGGHSQEPPSYSVSRRMRSRRSRNAGSTFFPSAQAAAASSGLMDQRFTSSTVPSAAAANTAKGAIQPTRSKPRNVGAASTVAPYLAAKLSRICWSLEPPAIMPFNSSSIGPELGHPT